MNRKRIAPGPGRTRLTRALMLGASIFFLAFLLACGLLPASNPAPTNPPPDVEQEEPSPVPTRQPTRPVTPIPTDEPEEVIPIPDFDEILLFAGGGAGPVSCLSYPSEPGTILVEPPELSDHIILCTYLTGIRPADPVQIVLEHPDSGVRLESSDLILDRGMYNVHWSAFSDADPDLLVSAVESWSREGSVRFALSVYWPATLPEGNWAMTVLQGSTRLAAGEFQFARPRDSAYIQALDGRSAEEALPADYFSSTQSLRLTENGRLPVSGVGYPPDVPVYLVLYEERNFQYELVQASALMSDSLGSIDGEIEAPFETGVKYLLYGLTDPEIALADLESPDCYYSSRRPSGFACDEFEIIPELLSSVPYSTQAPLSCPGAPPQYIIPDQPAYVCTRSDAVNLRADPSRSAEVLRQVEPGTVFHVESSGPSCADNWSWWFVSLDDGTSGWLAEGGDQTDPYFICPLP